MKTFFSFIVFFLFCLVVKSQTELGDFKINKTTVDFAVSKYPDFVEITDSTRCPFVRKFECKKYTMLKMNVYDIELMFYNDILIEFKCSRDPVIEKYITSKYGNPNFTQDSHIVKIDNIFYQEEINKFKWFNGDIITISTYTKRYNKYFNITVNSYFNIYLIKDLEKITNCK